jgi:hypothetical protein
LAIHHEEHKVFLTVLQKSAQGPIPLLLRDAARSPLFCPECRGHLCECDLCQQDGVLGLRIGELSNPGTSWLIGVAFDDGTGIEVVVCHGYGLRCSLIRSLREGPAA